MPVLLEWIASSRCVCLLTNPVREDCSPRRTSCVFRPWAIGRNGTPHAPGVQLPRPSRDTLNGMQVTTSHVLRWSRSGNCDCTRVGFCRYNETQRAGRVIAGAFAARRRAGGKSGLRRFNGRATRLVTPGDGAAGCARARSATQSRKVPQKIDRRETARWRRAGKPAKRLRTIRW